MSYPQLMPRKRSTPEKNYISTITFKELLEEIEFDLRVNEFVVLNIDWMSYSMEVGIPFRADFFCIILIKSGKIEFKLDNKSYNVTAGDIVFCPMSETFCVDYVSKDYNAKYIFFSVDFISQAGFNYRSNAVLKSLSGDPLHAIQNERELFKRVGFHLDELENLNSPDKDYYYFKEMIWHHFSLVIYEIDNHFKKTEVESNVTSREDEITTSFFTLVRQHFKEQHNVQFYADQLFISRKYLTKVINKTMFKSPREIIHQVLVVEARVLLRNSNANVGEVAAQLKFSDQASFSKFFKKHTGKSPLDYKREDIF
ncbi:AraC family transcriptional regulator [Chryseobacterium sp.]|uniref:helix-turn-helix domain-containing protein n=1 Tax=Chryseobacterium sp. TaxID=1871047 RepID=UPI0025BB1FCF|nr:AraC family transcriptional regulator [Chryseobacterium sp.]